MSKLYWQNEKKADTPYRLELFDLNIYSIEELCYLIRRKTSLIDRSIMKDELLSFLDDSLGYSVTSLRQLVHFNGSLATYCRELLSFSQFPVSKEEWETIRNTLNENELLTPFVRLVRQADALFEEGHYFKAFHAYAGNMKIAAKDTERAYLYGQMAKAAFFLFHYDVAAEFFMKSYQVFKEEKTLIGYLLCKRFMMTKQEYIAFATRNQEYYELTLRVERLYDETQEKAKAQTDAMLSMPDKEALLKEFREMME